MQREDHTRSGLGIHATELTTAVKYGIPIKHVLLNNHALRKISKEQLAGDYPVWHTSLHKPDWPDTPSCAAPPESG